MVYETTRYSLLTTLFQLKLAGLTKLTLWQYAIKITDLKGAFENHFTNSPKLKETCLYRRSHIVLEMPI